MLFYGVVFCKKCRIINKKGKKNEKIHVGERV